MGIFSASPLLLVLLVPLFSACASLGPGPATEELGREEFVLRGKLGITVPKTDVAAHSARPSATVSSSSTSLNFRWLQRDNSFDIHFWGPLGQGRSHLAGDARFVELTTPDGKSHRDTDPVSLMQHWFGWSLPLEVLQFWVQGRPAPGYAVAGVSRNESDELIGFEQLGWALEFQRYQSVADRRLPARTVAKKGENRLVVISRNWQFGLQKN